MSTLKSNLGLQHGYGVLVLSQLTWAATAQKVKTALVQPGQEWLRVARWSLDTAVRSRISVFRTLLLSLGYLSVFTAIVSQVGLVETTVDKVTCAAVPVHPVYRYSPGRYGNYSVHFAS